MFSRGALSIKIEPFLVLFRDKGTNGDDKGQNKEITSTSCASPLCYFYVCINYVNKILLKLKIKILAVCLFDRVKTRALVSCVNLNESSFTIK